MLKKLLPRTEFGRNVITLMTGTTVAQAVPILVSPVLTRMYSPNDFGMFATYMAIVMVLASVAMGRYELSVLLPKEDKSAVSLAKICGGIALVFCVLIGSVLAMFFENILTELGVPTAAWWFYFLPLSILLIALFQCLNLLSNRWRLFRNMALSRIVQSTTTACAQIAFSVLGAFGLVVGSLLGLLFSSANLLRGLNRASPISPEESKAISSLELAKRYRRFPLLQAPSTLIENASGQLPIFLLGALFGPIVVGFYALSQRVVRAPTMVVGSSIGEVFKQKASEEFVRSGDVRPLFISTLRRLFLISVIPFMAFAAFSPWLFSFVFGSSWGEAGEYARVLSPLFWLSFIVSPVSVMFIIAEKQHLDLMMQSSLLILSALALYVGYHVFQSAKASLALMTIVYSVKYIIELCLSYRFSFQQRCHGSVS